MEQSELEHFEVNRKIEKKLIEILVKWKKRNRNTIKLMGKMTKSEVIRMKIKTDQGDYW